MSKKKRGRYSEPEVLDLLRISGRTEIDRRIARDRDAGANPAPGSPKTSDANPAAGPELIRRLSVRSGSRHLQRLPLVARAAMLVLALGASGFMSGYLVRTLDTRHMVKAEIGILAEQIIPMESPEDFADGDSGFSQSYTDSPDMGELLDLIFPPPTAVLGTEAGSPVAEYE